ncbi:H-NS family nucleoid-associated regulatory protein [Pseudorhodoferax sp. Leaf265]|uniref:H-NS histone family protein n=1 Tax=Pseudorhodoferax sp. Leaf265 TaxID=1736315 RepID=UPI0006FFB9F7|nr:H-NS histone family protein [Pseudorhodoferax sp. Leaf265]KQP15570.1 hypothetical protein ASF45_28660 [Pseudorhodoferax sp. Leaf265]
MARRQKGSLADIEQQIEKLQQQAAELRAAEVAGVVDRIKAAIAHYGLSAEQLGFPVSKRSKAGSSNVVAAGPVAAPHRRKVKSAKVAGVAKYGDGTGKTWTGNGKRPRWFLDAIAAGKTAEDLLIATT